MIKAHQGIRKKTPVPLDAWCLGFLWSLAVGIWSFPVPSPLRLCVLAPSRYCSITSRSHAGWGRLVPTFPIPHARSAKTRHPNQAPIKAENPSNRTSSRHIKASAKNTRSLGAWWFSGAWRLEFGAFPSHPLCNSASWRLCVTPHRQSRQKPQQSCMIKAHQGKRGNY